MWMAVIKPMEKIRVQKPESHTPRILITKEGVPSIVKYSAIEHLVSDMIQFDTRQNFRSDVFWKRDRMPDYIKMSFLSSHLKRHQIFSHQIVDVHEIQSLKTQETQHVCTLRQKAQNVSLFIPACENTSMQLFCVAEYLWSTHDRHSALPSL